MADEAKETASQPKRKCSEKAQDQEMKLEDIGRLPKDVIEKNTRGMQDALWHIDLYQMSLAIMPLSISDQLRKRKKCDLNEFAGRAGQQQTATLMVRSPLYMSMLEAARQQSVRDGQSQGMPSLETQ